MEVKGAEKRDGYFKIKSESAMAAYNGYKVFGGRRSGKKKMIFFCKRRV